MYREPIRLAVALLLPCAGAAACGGFDPVGSYAGDATDLAQFTVPQGAPGPDGSQTATVTSTSGSHPGVTLVVTRVSERRLRLQLGSCAVEAEQEPAPNDNQGQVAISPPQRCTVQLQGYSGPMIMTGDFMFGRDDASASVMLSGSPPEARASASYAYSYVFSGRRGQ